MPKPKQKNKLSRFPLIIIPALLFVLLFFLTFIDLTLKKQVEVSQTYPLPFEATLSTYPVLAENGVFPFTSANGIVIIDGESKKVLFERNRDLRFSPASTVKIMTALTALSYYRLDDLLVVRGPSDVDSSAGLLRGEVFRFEELLYAMMLPSDNLASETIASNHHGGREEFIKLMNQNANAWSLKNTNFADASGLNDDFNYTTPYDMAILASIAMRDPILTRVVATRQVTIQDSENKKRYDIKNLNRLLDFDGVVGLKTGHTEKAGDVLVTAKRDRGHLLIMVVMNSQDRFLDTMGLLDFIRERINFLTIRP